MAQAVKNLPAMQETWVQSLDQENSLEKGMVTHSSMFAWEILWPEEPGGLQSTGLQKVGHDRATITIIFCHAPAISSVQFSRSVVSDSL